MAALPKGIQVNIGQYGYGPIPINTIFRGMNIHKSQLFWCELQGLQGFDTLPYLPGPKYPQIATFHAWLFRIPEILISIPRGQMLFVISWLPQNVTSKTKGKSRVTIRKTQEFCCRLVYVSFKWPGFFCVSGSSSILLFSANPGPAASELTPCRKKCTYIHI